MCLRSQGDIIFICNLFFVVFESHKYATNVQCALYMFHTVHVAMEGTKGSYLSLINCNNVKSELNILSEQWGSSMVDDMFFHHPYFYFKSLAFCLKCARQLRKWNGCKYQKNKYSIFPLSCFRFSCLKLVYQFVCALASYCYSASVIILHRGCHIFC